MKILVVDDEQLLVKGIRFHLQNDTHNQPHITMSKDCLMLLDDTTLNDTQ